MTSSKDRDTGKNKSKSYFSEDQFFIKLFHNTPAPKSLSNLSDRKIVDVNEAWEAFTGYSKKEAIGRTVEELELISYNEANQIREVLDKIEIIKQFEIELNVKNGQLKYGLFTFQHLDVNGKAYVQTTILDIHQLKKVQEDLRLAKEFSEELVSSLRQGLVVMNTSGEIIDVNPSFCEITQFAKEALLGTNAPFPFWPPESYETIQECLQQTLKGEVGNFEFLFMRKGGERFPAAIATSSIKNNMGDIIAFFVTVDDITDRKEAEVRIIKSEQYLNNIINNIGDPLFVKDDESRLLLVNDAFCTVFNLSRNDIIGKTLAEDVPPDERESFLCIDKEVLATGIENINEESLTIRDGDTRIISTKKNRFIDEHGNTYLIGVIRDITERKKAEVDLRLSKEFTDKLVMSMQEGLIIVDLEGKIIMVNNSTSNILGYSKEELVGLKLPYPFAKMEDFEAIAATNKKVAKGEKPAFQFEFIRKNGEPFLASFLTGNITNDKGEVIALFGTMKDISEETKAKNILEDIAIKSTQKKEVILELANLVGKDFNTSLKKITKLAAKTLNVERVSVWNFNAEKDEIYCKRLFSLSDGAHSSGLVIQKADNPNYFKALEKEKAILIPDAVNNPITKAFAKGYLIPNNIASLMDVFINSTKGYYGIICFEHVGAPRKWTADEQEFASSIANVVSLMVESRERKVAEDELVIKNEALKNSLHEINELKSQLEQENSYLRNELDLVFNYEEMVYGSTEFSNVLTEVEKVAPTTATVLLTGESGTGKELLARAIHNTSLRKNKPLIKVNCSAIPRELIESELFGHKKGSFTGAFSDKVGKFELADGGTLFLDEIGEMSLEMQPKILRFLQEGEIEVVGGTGHKKLDVRVIAATNRNLKEEIEKKKFREDLFFRLHVFPIIVPALRDRKDDIPLLVEHFVDKFNKSYSKHIKYIPDASMDALREYAWPGNIRELENLIERAVILSTDTTLLIPGFESSAQKMKQRNTSKNLSLEAVQRNHILQVLEQCDWKISGPGGASELLHLKPSTLRDKMAKLGLKKPPQN